MTRNVKSGSSFWPDAQQREGTCCQQQHEEERREAAVIDGPARQIEAARCLAVCLIRAHEHFAPTLGVWTRTLLVLGGSVRTWDRSTALRALAWQPDAHAIAKKLHACGDDHVSHSAIHWRSARRRRQCRRGSTAGLAHDLALLVDDERPLGRRRFRVSAVRGITIGAAFSSMRERDRCGHAEPHGLRRRVHGNANRIGPRGGVGLTGNFANPPVDARRAGPPRAQSWPLVPIVRRLRRPARGRRRRFPFLRTSAS